MAAISSTGTSVSSLSGYGGLASGLDRDELIKSMTASTRSKIASKQQAKTKIGWQQEVMRNITTQMYQFTNKYMSYSSSSNLLGSKLFSRSNITAEGANSKYVSVSGTATGSNNMSILGVRQMAKNAQLTTLKDASSSQIKTGDIAYNLNTETSVNLVSGEKIYVNYGNKDYTITLTDKTGHDYDTAESSRDAMNAALAEVSVGNGKTLADVMQVDVSGTGEMIFKTPGQDAAGNALRLVGGSNNVLQNLGFLKEGESVSSLSDDRKNITESGLTAVNKPTLQEDRSLAAQLGGKSISFNYNGQVSWIELPSEEDLKGKNLDDLQGILQKKLDTAFGAGRVKAELVKNESAGTGSFSFTTTKPKTEGSNIVPGELDTSSVLTITSAGTGLLGNAGVFQMEAGTSNRLNLSAELKNSGLAGAASYTGSMELKINNVDIEIGENDSINDIMTKINNSDAGVTVAYQQNTDRFIITATGAGASGSVNVEGDFGELLFGQASEHKIDNGQDAIIAVKYAGSDQVIEIERGSNTFTVDGLNITLKGQFGYQDGATDLAGLDTTTEAITFNAKVDADATTQVVKEMIDSFNEILALINGEVNQKPDRNYAPLTDEQKEEMSESQIEKWETEAKKGLLFNDSDLRSLSNSLRFILPTEDRTALANIGISTSTEYSDRGKLIFDETKFKAALEANPDAVKELFTKQSSTDENGNTVEGGVMAKMKTVMDRYAGTTGATKGVLIERAGSIYAPTTVLSNSMQKKMDSIDDIIDRLNDRLTSEQDRYVRQFTSLETAISQMNSQSSWLSQLSGSS